MERIFQIIKSLDPLNKMHLPYHFDIEVEDNKIHFILWIVIIIKQEIKFKGSSGKLGQKDDQLLK